MGRFKPMDKGIGVRSREFDDEVDLNGHGWAAVGNASNPGGLVCGTHGGETWEGTKEVVVPWV